VTGREKRAGVWDFVGLICAYDDVAMPIQCNGHRGVTNMSNLLFKRIAIASLACALLLAPTSGASAGISTITVRGDVVETSDGRYQSVLVDEKSGEVYMSGPTYRSKRRAQRQADKAADDFNGSGVVDFGDPECQIVLC
jgi:hypothetical protein